MAQRPHLKLHVKDMEDLISGSQPTISLLRALLAELKLRDSAAAARLRDRIELEIATRSKNPKNSTGQQTKYEDDNRQQNESQAINSKAYKDLSSRFEALKSQLNATKDREARLTLELAQYRANGASSNPLHGRVYLTANAPQWLILDVRRSFRTRYHPDRHEGVENKTRAQKVFQESEQVFSKIISR